MKPTLYGNTSREHSAGNRRLERRFVGARLRLLVALVLDRSLEALE
jgi:hypothetical protein